jgi:hypothetical protein
MRLYASSRRSPPGQFFNARTPRREARKDFSHRWTQLNTDFGIAAFQRFSVSAFVPTPAAKLAKKVVHPHSIVFLWDNKELPARNHEN